MLAFQKSTESLQSQQRNTLSLTESLLSSDIE